MPRIPLLNRRLHVSFNFRHEGFDYTAGLGYFDNGLVAEIFLDAAKAGSQLDASARDAAIAVSLALQYQCPIDVLYHSMTRNPDGSAAGPLGHVLDLIIKDKL